MPCNISELRRSYQHHGRSLKSMENSVVWGWNRSMCLDRKEKGKKKKTNHTEEKNWENHNFIADYCVLTFSKMKFKECLAPSAL
jgi:hypothetical protein